jgi:hypothetical protein
VIFRVYVYLPEGITFLYLLNVNILISPGPGSPEEGIGQPFRIPMLVLLAVPHGLHALKRKGERGLHDSKTMGR